MAFFHGTRTADTYGRMMIAWSFDQLKLDALYGTTPERNRAAVRFSEKLGFELHGPLPNYCTWEGELCAAWISAMTKARWIELQHGG
jgi:RimJ/RimL family protein N-acetyltransferase